MTSQQDYIIIATSLLLILTFFIIIAYFIRKSQISNQTVTSKSCNPGQCVTNVINGIKTCPNESTDILTANVINETCNSPFTCESSQTPYAVQTDGSTNIDGTCQKNVVCRCVRNPQCPVYITALFISNQGNPLQPFDSQRITFNQRTQYTNAVGNSQDNLPLIYEDPATEFCKIPSEWLPRISPGVCESLTTEQCILRNPCLSGTLAFIPDELPFNFSTQADLVPLACVQGMTCPSGQVAVFDKGTNQITCFNT